MILWDFIIPEMIGFDVKVKNLNDHGQDSQFKNHPLIRQLI
jgi:hypothetical protein